jgi:hypothetical protein
VLIGCGLLMAHVAFVGDHYDDTLFGQAFFAAVAVGLALLAHRLTRRARRRIRA